VCDNSFCLKADGRVYMRRIIEIICAVFLFTGFCASANVPEGPYIGVPIDVETDTSVENQRTIKITNLSGRPIYLGGTQVSFNYNGDSITAVWGTANVNWNIKQSNQEVTLTATVDYAPALAPEELLTITFIGNGMISNVNLMKPAYNLRLNSIPSPVLQW
jgi:hypothetical protein